MDLTDALGRNVAVYLWYYLGACFRYFAVAGALYAFFHIWFRRQWLAYRIQKAFPGRDEVGHEIRWSLLSMASSGVAGLLLYNLIQGGWTRTYFAVALHGWSYFALSVVLGIVGYDAWFYWQHRLLHTRWWFRHAHRVHHHSTNPTPFANFSHHPIEITLGNVYFILLPVLVPMHPIALGSVSMFVFGWGMITHLCYEFYPKGFTRQRAFGWVNTATHHNMHHSHVACNYGMFFNFWDRVMGTNHPAYRATFDAVKSRPTPEEPYPLAARA